MIKKTPKHIWILSAVFVAAQYLITCNVFLESDDYMYGTFAHKGIISSVYSYYFTGNGRWFVNLIDSFILKFDRYLYMVILPWILLLLGYLIYRFVCVLTNKKNSFVFGLTLGLLSVIDIEMTRESTYWITGSLNYLFPACLMVSGMLSALKIKNGSTSKKSIVFFGALCVLSCLGMEQYGFMSLGWMFLIWAYDCYKNKKVKKIYIIVFLLSAVALGTLVLAPGNSVRLEDAGVQAESIFSKAFNLVYYDFHSKTSSVFVFLLSALCAFRYFKVNKKVLGAVAVLNALVVLLCFDYGLFASSIVVAISAVLTIVTLVPALSAVFKSFGRFYLLALAVIGAGSQVMLLASQLWGFRTSFCLIVIYIFLFLIIASDIKGEEVSAISACFMLIAINPYAAIAGVILGIVFIFKKPPRVIAVILLAAVIVTGLSDEIIGFRKNSFIHQKNIRSLKSAATTSAAKAVVLSEFEDEQYGMNLPPLGEFHTRYCKLYYDLPDDIVFKYTKGK